MSERILSSEEQQAWREMAQAMVEDALESGLDPGQAWITWVAGKAAYLAVKSELQAAEAAEGESGDNPQ